MKEELTPTKRRAIGPAMNRILAREGVHVCSTFAAFNERYRLAHQILVRRRELRLSQARLAKIAGIEQAGISQIESGRANPTVGTLAAIARGLGMGLSLVPLDSPHSGTPAAPLPE